MKLRLFPVVLAAFASAPAFAIHVNISGFVYSSASSVTFNNDSTGFDYDGEAGEFKGTLSDTALTARTTSVPSVERAAAVVASSTSFIAYCAEITQSVYAHRDYQYAITNSASYFTSQKLGDLSRLFTATAGFVTSNSTSAAMQAAIWEIIYETGTNYNLNGGQVTIAANTAADRTAFAAINNDLAHLSDYAASYHIEVLTNSEAQDLIIASIPEPGTWALLLGGLGAIGFVSRRRGG